LNGLQCALQIPELFNGIEVKSGLLSKIVQLPEEGGCFPNLAEDLEWFFGNFDCSLAAKGMYEPTKGVDAVYDEACDAIDRIVAELNEYKDEMCANDLTPRALAKSSWKYVNVKPDSKDKYLIELPANVAVRDDFILKGKRGSGHKQVNKYRTPVVQQLVEEMERAYDIQKERKAKSMELIFAKFDSMRSMWAAAAQATALLDALGALAQTASRSGYTRPRILDCPKNSSPRYKVTQGRHPCVENLSNSAEFVPNDLSLGCSFPSEKGTSPRVLLLSGPNMGVSKRLQRHL
jgi:DNA mismatch repair protein MSH6